MAQHKFFEVSLLHCQINNLAQNDLIEKEISVLTSYLQGQKE